MNKNRHSQPIFHTVFADSKDNWVKEIYSLKTRLSIIYPWNCGNDKPSNGVLTKREKWAEYLNAANKHDYLNSSKLGDLRSAHDEQFRGALAECIALWFFDNYLKSTIKNIEGKKKPDFSFMYNEHTFEVEVKSQETEIPAANEFRKGQISAISWWGTRGLYKFETELNKASTEGKEYEENSIRIICLVPNILTDYPCHILHNERSLICHKIWDKNNKNWKGHLKKINAILIIEQVININSQEYYIKHTCMIIHNPNNYCPLIDKLIKSKKSIHIIRTIKKDNKWIWSDNQELVIK